MDVEEWFHVPGHPVGGDSRLWAGLPPRLSHALAASLDLLASLQVQATFFVLGWAATRHRAALRRISEDGHEVACHGNLHRRVDGLSPRAFRLELREGRRAVEDACGCRVRGFRAPMWSMGGHSWPYEVLAEEGFHYSSSRLAVPFLGGGRGAPPGPVAGVREVPALRAPWRWIPLPVGGTVFLRRLPLRFLEDARDAVLSKGGPAVYWFHPWELDPGSPRLALDPFRRFARFSSLPNLSKRLHRLIGPGDRRINTWIEKHSGK